MAKGNEKVPTVGKTEKESEVDEDLYGNIDIEEDDDKGDPIPAKKTVAKKDDDTTLEAIEHPKRLLRRAKDTGLTEAELAEYKTSEELEEAVYVREREVIAELRGRTKATEKTKEEEKKVEEDKVDWGTYEIEDEDGKKRVIQESDIAKPIVHVVKKLVKEIGELKGKLASKDQQEKAIQEKTTEQLLDTAFNKFTSKLGKGTAKDVKDTAFMKRRQAVYLQVSLIPDSEKASLTLEQAVVKVMKDLYDVEPDSEKAEEVEQKPKKKNKEEDLKQKFKDGKVSKPTARKAGDLPKGDKKARSSVKELVDSWGEEDGDDDDDDDDSEY